MSVLVTGAAGFIGFYVSHALLERGEEVIGIDNLNDYYDVKLKQDRLKQLDNHDNFQFYKANIADRTTMESIADSHKQSIAHVIHLAAQAGVRYSLENPYAYLESNLNGHLVMLELCRQHLPHLEHMVYASSSSVYGGNTKLPFSVEDKTDTPVSLYAATKKSDELMTHAYCHLYGLRATGLRFFTVYGPWGRPDMAYFLFAKAITEGRPIRVFNHGNMFRDFTYIDDIVAGVLASMGLKDGPLYQVFNLGNNQTVALKDMIHTLEDALGMKAEMQLEPMQPGDVKETYADIDASRKAFGYTPNTSIKEGLAHFVRWYREYYSV